MVETLYYIDSPSLLLHNSFRQETYTGLLLGKGFYDSDNILEFFFVRHRYNYNQMLVLTSPMTFIGFEPRVCWLHTQCSNQ